MPLLNPAVQSLFTSGRRPRVVWKGVFRAAAASLDITTPKVPGMLSVVATFHFGGTAEISAPSGYTQINANNASATNPGGRSFYRYLDGSEAATHTLTATGGTEMVAFAWLISGSIASGIPQGSNGSISSASAFDAVTRSLTASGAVGILQLSGAMMVGSNSLLSTPYYPPFDPTRTMFSNGTNFAFFCEAEYKVRNFSAGEGQFVVNSAANGRRTSILVKGQ